MSIIWTIIMGFIAGIVATFERMTGGDHQEHTSSLSNALLLLSQVRARRPICRSTNLLSRTSWETFFVPSFFIARERLTSIVFSRSFNSAAIFLFGRWRATKAKICNSRVVSVANRLATALKCNLSLSCLAATLIALNKSTLLTSLRKKYIAPFLQASALGVAGLPFVRKMTGFFFPGSIEYRNH